MASVEIQLQSGIGMVGHVYIHCVVPVCGPFPAYTPFNSDKRVENIKLKTFCFQAHLHSDVATRTSL